jgi:hypothetical protein
MSSPHINVKVFSITNTERRRQSFTPSRRIARRGMIMAKHSEERSYPKHIALLTSLFLPLGAIALLSDAALAQQQQQRAQVRRTATRTTPERVNATTNTTPETTPVPAALPSPAIDNTSALGQALAACNQGQQYKRPSRFPD